MNQESSTESGTAWSRLRQWPIVELALLAGPTVAQMASYTLMQFADRGMLASVGDMEAAAAGTAGLTFFAIIGFGFGVMLVVNTLVSQSFGRGDLPTTGRYLWQGVWFGSFFGLAALLLYPWAEPMFRAMGHEARMATLEAEYFRVVALGGAIKLAAMAMAQFLLGLHRPTIVFVGTLGGVFANVFFNWLLIYGNWGFPKMGVAGAVWGTNAAICVELLVMCVYIFRPKFAAVHHTFDYALRSDMFARLLRVGLPAGFQLTCDILAWAVFLNVIVATFGTPALQANSFAFTYMHICFMPAVGVGAAVTAMVGKYIGMGRHDLAEKRAHLGFFVCAVYMVIAGIMLFLWRTPLIGFFSTDPEVRRIGELLMLFIALYQIFDAMFVNYVGALRGAGDTLVPAVVQAALVWTIVVGGGALAAKFAPQLGVIGPWTLATFFGACLGIFLLIRFKRGGWKSINLEQDTNADKVPNLNVALES